MRLMRGKSLLDMFHDGVDIAKLQPFFRSKLQLPADTLFGKECRPAALPGVGLWRGGKIVIKIKTKLRLIAPLMQTSNLLAQHKRVVRVQRTGREIIHHQKAVVAIAAKRPDLRD
ncbi:hypothetical protein D3C85_1532870 [compost metagenome]